MNKWQRINKQRIGAISVMVPMTENNKYGLLILLVVVLIEIVYKIYKA
jgi:hypothetical protein